MNSFSYTNPTRIFLGQDVLAVLDEEIKALGPKLLVHYGQSSIKKNGIYDEVTAKLKALDIEFYDLGGVKANPDIELVHQGVSLCHQHKITGILAIGGGSVIDSAKAIAAGVYSADIEAAFIHGLPPVQALPVGCILTIPAAGSEASPVSVITNKTHKRSIHAQVLYPRFALINPAYFVTLSRYQAACGISDILAHLLERYFTHSTHVEYTDKLLEASMKTLINQAYLIMQDSNNRDAWAEIAFVGNLAHNGLLGSGRIEDWSSHRIEHELSAYYDIAHGAGLAIVFPAWMKYVYKENPSRFVQFAQNVFAVDYSLDQEELIIREGIHRYENFLKDIFLPVRLSEAGIFSLNFDEMIENCFHARPDSFGNFKKLNREDMRAILEIAR